MTNLAIGKFPEEVTPLTAVFSDTCLHGAVALSKRLLHAFSDLRRDTITALGRCSLATFLRPTSEYKNTSSLTPNLSLAYRIRNIIIFI